MAYYYNNVHTLAIWQQYVVYVCMNVCVYSDDYSDDYNSLTSDIFQIISKMSDQ